MKKYSLALNVALFTAMLPITSLSASTGPYLFIGGGAAWLMGSQLSRTEITTITISANLQDFAISYKQKSAFDYFGQIAFGYFFYESLSQIYNVGIEAGFNYFSPVKGIARNELLALLTGLRFNVTTNETSTTWSTDLAGIYRQRLGQSHVNLLLKLGLGYESMNTRISNAVEDLPDELPATAQIKNTGAGVFGGIGFEYIFAQHVSLRGEIDALKGSENIGYVQSLVGLAWLFK